MGVQYFQASGGHPLPFPMHVLATTLKAFEEDYFLISPPQTQLDLAMRTNNSSSHFIITELQRNSFNIKIYIMYCTLAHCTSGQKYVNFKLND